MKQEQGIKKEKDIKVEKGVKVGKGMKIEKKDIRPELSGSTKRLRPASGEMSAAFTKHRMLTRHGVASGFQAGPNDSDNMTMEEMGYTGSCGEVKDAEEDAKAAAVAAVTAAEEAMSSNSSALSSSASEEEESEA